MTEKEVKKIYQKEIKRLCHAQDDGDTWKVWRNGWQARAALQPQPKGRCEGCGELIPMSEVDSVGGHARITGDEYNDGDAIQVHCGPVNAIEAKE